MVFQDLEGSASEPPPPFWKKVDENFKSVVWGWGKHSLPPCHTGSWVLIDRPPIHFGKFAEGKTFVKKKSSVLQAGSECDAQILAPLVKGGRAMSEAKWQGDSERGRKSILAESIERSTDPFPSLQRFFSQWADLYR